MSSCSRPLILRMILSKKSVASSGRAWRTRQSRTMPARFSSSPGWRADRNRIEPERHAARLPSGVPGAARMPRPKLDHDVHLVLADLGARGHAFLEIDPAEATFQAAVG